MTWILKEKWLWIIFLAIFVIMVVPFVVLDFILQLPDEGKIIATILIVIGWGVAAGYKDWVKSKREEQRKK